MSLSIQQSPNSGNNEQFKVLICSIYRINDEKFDISWKTNGKQITGIGMEKSNI